MPVRYTAGAAPGACDVTMDAQVGVRFRVYGQGLGFRVQGLGNRVYSLGFRV